MRLITRGRCYGPKQQREPRDDKRLGRAGRRNLETRGDDSTLGLGKHTVSNESGAQIEKFGEKLGRLGEAGQCASNEKDGFQLEGKHLRRLGGTGVTRVPSGIVCSISDGGRGNIYNKLREECQNLLAETIERV